MTNQFSVVGLHLDLKYLMPRKEYLLRWLREISDCGINTLLLEYEDKFPWRKYPFLQAAGAWTPDELRQFLQTARELKLRVVPLVQTFSHLEFALAHPELSHLRELPDIWTQINPANRDAIAFVHDLIDEVLEYHEADEWFHIGADETWFMGKNPEYSREVESIGAPAFWAKHTRQFVDKIIACGKRPVVWDDVLWRGLPRAVAPDFPTQTILAAWDYGARKYEPGIFPQVEVFRDAGFDVIGAPCLNWGVLTPMHDNNLANTEVWAAKAKDAKMLGIINTSWASFHTPLPTQMLYVGATAALLEEDRNEIDAAWQSDWLQNFFGAPADEMPLALQNLGTNWEHQVGLARPITPIVYGFMDMMLHYPDGVTDRKKRGGYPLNWDEVNFASILRQKIELLKNDADQNSIRAKLDELQELYDHASGVLQRFAASVTRHQDEAKLLAFFAQMKSLHARIMRFFVFGEGDAKELSTQIEAQKPPFIESVSPFYEDAAMRRLTQILWEPSAIVLGEMIQSSSES